MRKFLKNIKKLINKLFGTFGDELYWRFRHLFADPKWAENYISENSISHAHRQFLIDKIAAYAPIENILEIGCASGPNLYLLKKRFPNIKTFGIDISKYAVRVGQEWFNNEKITDFKFSEGKADDLREFSDKSIDIIFTDAILIYIGPEKIRKVIKEIMRVARKAVILNERHDSSTFCSYKDHWIYNYEALLSNFINIEKIMITKIPKELWPVEGWKEFGAVIEAVL